MKLNNQNIVKATTEVQDFFESVGVSKKDQIKINLIIEESLLRFQEHFGEDTDFIVKTRKWFSLPKVIIRVKGQPFDPLKNNPAILENSIFSDEILQNLLIYETAKTNYNYNYNNGYNEIITVSTKELKPLKIPGGLLTVIFFMAVACSFLVKLLPVEIQSFIVDACTPSLLNLIMNLIVAVMGPFVFIAVLSGILAIGNIDTLSNIGFKVIRRFFLLTAITSIIAAIVAQVFYPVLVFDFDVSFDSNSNQTVNLFSNIVPKNLFTPFTDGNVLQIIFIAVAAGICIILIGETLPELKKLINELKSLIFKMMDLVSKIMLATIFLSVFQTLTTQDFNSIISVWQIIAVNYITFVIICGLMLLNIAVKYKVDIKNFFKNFSEVFLIAFSTGSTTVVMSKNMNIAVKKFNIEEKFCSFWIPLSHAICTPTKAAALVICIFYGAAVSDNLITVMQLLITLFLAIQLSVAVPPGPGGLLPIYIMMFQQMNLPLDAIGSLMIVEVFTVNLAAAVVMITKNCELIDISHQVNF